MTRRLRCLTAGCVVVLTTSLARSQVAVDPASPSRPAPVLMDRFVVTPSHFDLADPRTGNPSTLTQRDLETLPQVGEDLFRSIARLPGVAADDFTAKFWVRGAPQRQLLVRLDGADLLEPFHLKDVDGALSTIDLRAIARLDLMTGGFNADFGNRAAGVLLLESVSPTGPRPTSSLGLSLTSMRVGAAGTLAAGRARWLASIRRGYPDIALRVEGRGDDIFPRYWDAYAKAEVDLSPDHAVSVHFLHAADTLRVVEEDGPALHSQYGSDTTWARWQARFSERIRMETVASAAWLTWHRDGNGLYGDRYRLELRDRRSLATIDLRQDWSIALTGRPFVRAGWNYGHGSADYSYRLLRDEPFVRNGQLVGIPRTLQLSPSVTGESFGAFAAAQYAPTDRLTVEPGIRFDRHPYTADSHLSPRLNVALQLAAATTLRAAWGAYGQAQGLHELAVPFGDASFRRAELAEHRILSLEHRFANGVSARLESYQRLTRDPQPHWINRFNSYNVFPEAQTDRLLLRPDRATAQGIELMLQQRGRSRFDWTISYALARATEQIAGAAVPVARDQRHTFYADLSYSPTPLWRLSAAWQFHTGWPITDTQYSLATLANGSRITTRGFGPVFGSRLPAYHRLDLRASRTIPLRHGTLKVFVDIFNATNRDNAIAYDYSTTISGGVLTVRKHTRAMLPIIPSAGISWDL